MAVLQDADFCGRVREQNKFPWVTFIPPNRKNLSWNLPQNNKKEREDFESDQKFIFEWSDLVVLRITTIFLRITSQKSLAVGASRADPPYTQNTQAA